MITYDKFKSIGRDDTYSYIHKLLVYINYFCNERSSISISRGDYTFSDKPRKILALAIYALSFEERYNSLLKKYGFDETCINITGIKDISGENLSQNLESVLPDEDDLSYYVTLTPIEVLLEIFKKYSLDDYSNQKVFNALLPKLGTIDTLKKALKKLNLSIKEPQEDTLEETVFEGLSISVISFLETASIIRDELLDTLDTSNPFITCTGDDMVPLSLLLACFYCKDTKEKETIKEYFQKRSLNLNNITRLLGLNLKLKGSRNLAAISLFYKNFIHDGVNKDKKPSDITVSSILENTFNRDFTNSLSIEKILLEVGANEEDFSNLEAKITSFEASKEEVIIEKEIHDFYKDFRKEIIEFIEFTTKIYTILMNRINSAKCNKELLKCEDDADTLALLIASYYYKADISVFYQDNGISLDNILKLLNIELTQEEIEATPIDKRVLTSRFKRFIYEGVNRNASSKNITVNTICHNLCNREFNRSTIMESIFTELSGNYNIEADFLKQLNAHLEEKKITENLAVRDELFRDIPLDTIGYLENVYIIYTNLLNTRLPDWTTDELAPLAILLAISSTKNKPFKDFFRDKILNENTIANTLNININSLKKNNNKIDYRLLKETFKDFIFGGNNEGKERANIDILSIISNAFNKKLSSGIAYQKLLSKVVDDDAPLNNIEDCFKKYLKVIEEREEEEQAYKSLENNHGNIVASVLKTAYKIYKVLVERISKKPNKFIKCNDDCLVIALLIALSRKNYLLFIKYFTKHNLTEENILKALELKPLNIESIPMNSCEAATLFSKFLTQITPNDNFALQKLALDTLDSSISNSDILNTLGRVLSFEPRILETEVRFLKDYEETLTTEDRILALKSTTPETIDLSNISSMLNFGSTLGTHSKYIHDELPKLAREDHLSSSTASINGLIGDLYKTEEPPKKQGFLRKFFSISTVDDKPKLVLDIDKVEILKSTIGEQVDTLKQECLAYDTMRRYIEIYREKNKELLDEVNAQITRLKERLSSLNPQNNDDYPEFLTVSSALQIMQDKSNRFTTTNHLTNQELLKISQSLVNHFMTINALEMARDDLLPLIGTELAIAKGRNNEQDALKLSENVIELFQALLNQNSTGALESIERLRTVGLQEGALIALNRNIDTYVAGLERLADTSARISGALKGPSDNITLTLTPGTLAQPDEPSSKAPEPFTPGETTSNSGKPFVMKPKDDKKAN